MTAQILDIVQKANVHAMTHFQEKIVNLGVSNNLDYQQHQYVIQNLITSVTALPDKEVIIVGGSTKTTKTSSVYSLVAGHNGNSVKSCSANEGYNEATGKIYTKNSINVKCKCIY